uniref:Uncharacterized protein n=1 Tax=Tetradesmus obliquus TaxID=3088 RepID=A0A383VGC4_TETOB|eukprot:jgi/Sobl393_1/19971/SZX64598.1
MAGVLSATCTNGAWSATSGMCVNTPPPPNPNVADLPLTDCGIEGRDVVATSTLILQRDDDWALLTLPFEFTSYGTACCNLGVSCNGYLTFGAAGTDGCYYTSLWTDPADRADCVPLNSPAVAIFLTDVVPGSVLYYSDESTDDPSNPYIIIQYTMSTIYNSRTHLGQFQIYMFKIGDIGFIYNTIYAWPESKGERAVVGIMSTDNSGTRTFNMFSEGEQKLKPGLALLFKPKGVDGYESAVTWTDAVKYVKFVQNPGAPPRPVITFPPCCQRSCEKVRPEAGLDYVSRQPGCIQHVLPVHGHRHLAQQPHQAASANLYRLDIQTHPRHPSKCRSDVLVLHAFADTQHLHMLCVGCVVCSVTGCSKACPVDFQVVN